MGGKVKQDMPKNMTKEKALAHCLTALDCLARQGCDLSAAAYPVIDRMHTQAINARVRRQVKREIRNRVREGRAGLQPEGSGT